MFSNELLMISGAQVRALLDGAESSVVEAVGEAYRTFARGQSSLPHSSFVRFPERPNDRIIALPGFLGGDFEVAGIKWIASVPGNVQRGMERASAMIILNESATGHPRAILEGSHISAARTAASAALAARVLCSERQAPAGVVGCGRIAFECVRFLQETLPETTDYRIFDLDRERAARFATTLEQRFPKLSVELAESCTDLLATCPLVTFTTTAAVPHVDDLSMCPDGATILNVSLRDLSADVILANDNVVDDLDHVCRAQTSIHLAAEQCGHRGFVRASLGEILNGEDARPNPGGCTIFSPFGLGVLDLAVSDSIYRRAIEAGLGTRIEGFLDEPIV